MYTVLLWYCHPVQWFGTLYSCRCFQTGSQTIGTRAPGFNILGFGVANGRPTVTVTRKKKAGSYYGFRQRRRSRFLHAVNAAIVMQICPLRSKPSSCFTSKSKTPPLFAELPRILFMSNLPESLISASGNQSSLVWLPLLKAMLLYTSPLAQGCWLIETWCLCQIHSRTRKTPIKKEINVTMGFAVRVRSAGQKYGPTCHQRDRADVTEFVTLVRLSSLGQHVGVLVLAGYKRRKSALTAGPIGPLLV